MSTGINRKGKYLPAWHYTEYRWRAGYRAAFWTWKIERLRRAYRPGVRQIDERMALQQKVKHHNGSLSQ